MLKYSNGLADNPFVDETREGWPCQRSSSLVHGFMANVRASLSYMCTVVVALESELP